MYGIQLEALSAKDVSILSQDSRVINETNSTFQYSVEYLGAMASWT